MPRSLRVLLPAALGFFCALAPAGAIAIPDRSASSVPDPGTPRFVISEVHDRYERVAPDPVSAAGAAATAFQDDFESGIGNWTVTDDSGAGVQWLDADCWAASGTRSAACAAGGPQGIVCGADYPAGIKTWMVHGPIDLSDSSICTAALEFTVDLDTESGLDGLFAAVSTDGVRFSGVQFAEPTQGTFAIDLAPQFGAPQVWIGFRFHSDGSIGLPDGAHVDDVIVRRTPAPPATNARYGFTLSFSDTDPRVHVTPSNALPHLWFTCDSQGGGFSAMDIGLLQTEWGFETRNFILYGLNGFLVTANGSGGYSITHPSCPAPPVAMAMVLAVVSVAGWRLCFDPCVEFSVLSCDPTPARYAADFVGISSNWPGDSPCQTATLCGVPTPVESRSWGSIKSLYR